MTVDEGSSGVDHRQLLARANQLYELFGKSLEQLHLGQFVAIAPDGRTLVRASAGEVGRRAEEVERLESDQFPYLPLESTIGERKIGASALLDTGFDGDEE
ncbi:MAG TPA: hypothetical protein VK821_08470 [Dehalococcoidia bacterium]|nr:hypothetical protein [Dehalococcoidia bacterium]